MKLKTDLDQIIDTIKVTNLEAATWTIDIPIPYLVSYETGIKYDYEAGTILDLWTNKFLESDLSELEKKLEKNYITVTKLGIQLVAKHKRFMNKRCAYIVFDAGRVTRIFFRRSFAERYRLNATCGKCKPPQSCPHYWESCIRKTYYTNLKDIIKQYRVGYKLKDIG